MSGPDLALMRTRMDDNILNNNMPITFFMQQSGVMRLDTGGEGGKGGGGRGETEVTALLIVHRFKVDLHEGKKPLSGCVICQPASPPPPRPPTRVHLASASG